MNEVNRCAGPQGTNPGSVGGDRHKPAGVLLGNKGCALVHTGRDMRQRLLLTSLCTGLQVREEQRREGKKSRCPLS